MPPRSWWRPWRSLRGRATLAFAAVALALAVLMGAAVWLAVSQYLLAQRQATAEAQTVANAVRLEAALRASPLPPAELLAQLPRSTGSVSLVRYDGQWSTTSLAVGPEALGDLLVAAVGEGSTARQRIDLGGRLALVVGTPLPGGAGSYFEVFALEDLEQTAEALGAALVVAALFAPLLGLGLGRWATRPALRPLARLSTAASALAGGDPSARIDPGDDRDLAPLAAAFNRTALLLGERLRADARFAADVSHELRSPLTALFGVAGLLESHRDRLPPDGEEALDLLRGELARFDRLVSDLLEISRGDAGAGELVLEDVVLADLVARSLPPRERALLTVEPHARDVVVLADKRRLDRVLANLVDNADKHGGGVVAVTVTADGPLAQVLVDDAGPGVPAPLRSRVFERFARNPTTARAAADGAGLGLALVQRHVRAMGGVVRVTERPGGGARFVVGLPGKDSS